MTTFSFSAVRGGGRAAVRPGPVTLAIRGVRPNEAPTWEVRQAQIDAEERAALRALRERITAQIEEDQSRIERCLNALDLLDGDADLEDDADDEPSLCGASSCHLGGTLTPSTLTGDDREPDAGDEPEQENEHGSDCDLGEETLGWAANVGQINLGPNTADGDATALEAYGGGFRRSGHEDDEDSHDREHDEAERGIADDDGRVEQFAGTRYAFAGVA